MEQKLFYKYSGLPPLVTGRWTLEELRHGKLGNPKHGLKVFSCFHCGGGSTMGYKLAGFDVLGGVEIDPEMMKIYRANHNPRYSYLMGVQEFKNIPDEKLPKELFELDVLDGSPPCSSFSMAGSREKAWGEKKKFREGQAEQVLDDLFFHFIDVAKKLKPKIVVAENVKGLIQGNAKGYVKEIFQAFREAGYETQLFLLNASRMGVPQTRERTFFIAQKRALETKKIQLVFNELPVTVKQALGNVDSIGKEASIDQKKWWNMCKPGKPFSSIHPKGSWFNSFKLNQHGVAPTVTGSAGSSASGFYHWEKPHHLSEKAYARLQTFPDDFDYRGQFSVYVNGMSVPPFMMQRVATEIAKILLWDVSPKPQPEFITQND